MGTLVIDIADAKKGQLAWRGMGVKEVDTQNKPEKRDKSINEAVKKIFKNYPPKQTRRARAPLLRRHRRDATNGGHAGAARDGWPGHVRADGPGPAAFDP